MRPRGRSRGSVPGRKNVTTLNRIVPLSTHAARQQCIDPRRQPTAEWFSRLRASISRGMLSPEASARHIFGRGEMGRKRSAGDAPVLAAGNGLLDRRTLLAAGASLAGAGAIAARPALGAGELSVEPWMTEPGA